jgi:polyhydroxybutyrate depolymerase
MGDATCTSYGTCMGGAEVVHCMLQGDGHTWPGGVPIPFLGGTSSSISADEAMYNFFTAHPHP